MQIVLVWNLSVASFFRALSVFPRDTEMKIAREENALR